MVSDRFRLRYRLKPEHYLDYRKLSLSRMKKGRSWKRILPILAAGVIVGLLMAVLQSQNILSDREVNIGFAGAALGVLMIFLLATSYVKFGGMARSMVGVHNALVGEFNLTAYDGGGIQITGKHITSSYEWSAFVEMTNAKDLLILWVDRGAGVIIPAKAFPGEDERSQFADYVAERIDANRQVEEHPEP
ncbi:MAG: YcxB family protein [Hyphomicrobiaceae bacterium]|nr:YcxB family protein [Hyphomicrobiaceae bacterium]